MARRTFAEVAVEARASERKRVLAEVVRALRKAKAGHLVDAVLEHVQATKAVD